MGITVKPAKEGAKDYYGYKELIKTLKKNCKGQIVMIIGSCHSGGFAEAAKGESRVTVMAACAKEESLGDKNDRSHEALDTGINYLHYYTNKGMTKKHPMDADKDKKITVKEYYDYIKKSMKKHGLHPKYWAKDPKAVIYQY